MKNSLQPRSNREQIVKKPGASSAGTGWTHILGILSASMLFCLSVMGCDSQEKGAVDSRESTMAQSEIGFEDRDGGNNPPENRSDSGDPLPKIVAFGDSLTAGLGVSRDQSYPGQLEKKIQALGYGYQVINAGVSGETTAGGVRRTEWILKSQPALVILELGANDALRGQPLQQSYTNLETIITRLKEEGVSVILAGMKIPLNYGEAYTQEFEGMYERLAAKLQVPLIPFFLEGVAAQRELNQGDGIHPTAEGYALVVENVWKVLKPLLEARGTRP